MYTIAKNESVEIEIKKSKFIAKIYKIKQIDEIKEILFRIRKEYADATHICYAYKLKDNIKFSDDGEPGGTAGLPIVEVLNKNQLDYVLAIVIRYFGGIKLGSGGLIRAYSSSIAELIQKAQKLELIEGYKIQIVCSYEKTKQLDYMLKDINNIQKEYSENILYTLDITKERLETLKEWDPKIIENIIIEKNPKD